MLMGGLSDGLFSYLSNYTIWISRVLRVFNCAMSIIDVVFTYQFSSYLALLPRRWITLSSSSLVLIYFHEHDNDSLGSPLFFLLSPSQAGGKLPSSTSSQMLMPTGSGALRSSHFAYFLENLIHSHCFHDPLLHSDSQIHLRPLWSFGSSF